MSGGVGGPFVDLGIPGYDQAEAIGRGGFAAVYRARRQRFGDFVAIKLIDAIPDERALRRFEGELEAVGKVAGHRNIVTVHDAGRRADGRPYIVMELVPGGTLGDHARRQGPLPWPEVVEVGTVLAGALQWAHDRGVVHRDVKPENVLVDDRFTAIRDRIKLSDFGVAAIRGRTVASNEWTLAHAAPEMLLNGAAPSVKTDIYSLASTLFELLDGEAPFVTGDDQVMAQVFARVQQGAIRALRTGVVPEPIASVIECGLDRCPENRPHNAEEFATLLREAVTNAATPASLPTDNGTAPRPVRDPSASGSRGLRAHLKEWLRMWWSWLSLEVILIIAGGVASIFLVVALWSLTRPSSSSESPVRDSPSSTTTPVPMTTGPVQATTTLPAGTVFSDDFGQGRGWYEGDDGSARYTLTEGQYQIVARVVRRPLSKDAPLGPAPTGTRTRVEVDAIAVTPGSSGLSGVACRRTRGDYYYGQVGADGYWRIVRAGSSAAVLRDATSPSNYVKNLAFGTPVHIVLECSGSAALSAPVTLKLFVNGVEVGSANDATGFGPGGAGLVLTPDVAGEWRFDNFVVTRF